MVDGKEVMLADEMVGMMVYHLVDWREKKKVVLWEYYLVVW